MYECVYIYIYKTGKYGQTSISLSLENVVSFTFIYLYIVISEDIGEYCCCMLQNHCEKQIYLYMHLYIVYALI